MDGDYGFCSCVVGGSLNEFRVRNKRK